ncbi:MAG TPA: DUF4349 domain-containing protein [Verrucomicrobiae bacterium]|nr:DUF4349 domain-containing protein [Verrucomicrobiae bacterium]
MRKCPTWSRLPGLDRGGARLGPQKGGRRPAAAVVTAALAVACGLIVVGCASTAIHTTPGRVSHERAGPAVAFAGVAPPAPATGSAAPPLLTANRALIHTANLTVRVRDVRAAAERAATLAATAGGYLESEQVGSPPPILPEPIPFVPSTHRGVGRAAWASVTVRVPSPRFQPTVTTLAALGTLITESVQTQDVTQQVVDVTSRVASATAAVARLRTLFARAKTVGAVLAVQSALASEEATLESLQAQAAVLSRQTQLTTVTATFLAAAVLVHRAPAAGFVSGLRAGWHTLTTAGQALLVAGGFALPWVLLLGAVAGLASWGWRQRSVRRGGSDPPPTPTASGPSTAG